MSRKEKIQNFIQEFNQKNGRAPKKSEVPAVLLSGLTGPAADTTIYMAKRSLGLTGPAKTAPVAFDSVDGLVAAAKKLLEHHEAEAKRLRRFIGA